MKFVTLEQLKKVTDAIWEAITAIGKRLTGIEQKMTILEDKLAKIDKGWCEALETTNKRISGLTKSDAFVDTLMSRMEELRLAFVRQLLANAYEAEVTAIPQALVERANRADVIRGIRESSRCLETMKQWIATEDQAMLTAIQPLINAAGKKDAAKVAHVLVGQGIAPTNSEAVHEGLAELGYLKGVK